MMTRYSLANIYFTLEGNGALVDALRAFLQGLEDDSNARRVDLRLRFVDTLPDLGAYLSIPPLKAGQGAYEAAHGTLTYQLKDLEPGYEALIHIGQGPIAAQPEAAAADFIEHIFIPLSQFVHLEHDTSYLRASSFERDGRAVALVGQDAITSAPALLDRMREDGWKLLGDGLSLINRDGIASPNRCRHRISNNAAAPGPTGAPTKLTDLYFVERAQVSGFGLQSLSVPDVARQSAVLLLKELPLCVEHATALHCASYDPILPRPDDFYQFCFNIARQGFAAQRPNLLRVPVGAEAEKFAGFLMRKLGD